MAMNKFSVTKSAQAMVLPCESTPHGTLGLSAIDKLPGLRCKVRTLHVYRHGREPAKVIREALATALVHYYPLAGRLAESSGGELEIACTGEGVWFVQASANCSLEDVDCLNDYYPLAAVSPDDLLPDPRPEIDPTNVLVLMQVTQFTCGGFVIGLEFCHSICDGLGAAQFLNAVAEFARSAPGLRRDPISIAPVWWREAIPTPISKKLPVEPPAIPNYKLERAVSDLSLDQTGLFKRYFFELTGQRCSTFEVLAAGVWRCRTRAVGLAPDADVKLVFFANARPLIRPAPPPEGFYGNCFFPVSVVAPAGVVASGTSAVEVVKLIKEAKARLPGEFAEWVAGSGGDPYRPSLSYNTLFVSEWSRLGFGQVDYGWGTPAHLVPLTYSDVIPVCILGSPPAPKTGARLITQCVEEEHLPAFRDQLNSFGLADF